MGVPTEILRMRWNHMEERRVEKILYAREEREKVIREETEGQVRPEFEFRLNTTPKNNATDLVTTNNLRILSNMNELKVPRPEGR